jgi:hypothetical protein
MVMLSMTKNSTDISYNQWLVQIAMALAQTLAIVTACVPYLKPFMDGLESGMIRSDDLLRRAEPSGKGSGYAYGKNQKTSSIRPTKPSSHEMAPIKNVTISTITVGKTPHKERDWDVGSDSSQTKIIKQTKSWGVVSSDAVEVGTSDQDSR